MKTAGEQKFAHLRPLLAKMLDPDPLHRPSIESLLASHSNLFSLDLASNSLAVYE